VLMVGLAAACQKQDSNKEGEKRLHSPETVAALKSHFKSFSAYRKRQSNSEQCMLV